MRQLQERIFRLVYPLVWAHEYCHYWTARQLGLLARIQGARTYVHRANLPQHLLIAIAPTVPYLLFFSVSVALFRRFAYSPGAVSPGAVINYGSLVAIAALLLLSCAQDWWVIVRGLLDPGVLAVDSTAILVVSGANPRARQALQKRVEGLGYFVDWARSISGVEDALDRNPFDLVVLDGSSTGISPERLEQMLERSPENRTARIFPLQAHAELARLPAYLEYGVPADYGPAVYGPANSGRWEG